METWNIQKKGIVPELCPIYATYLGNETRVSQKGKNITCMNFDSFTGTRYWLPLFLVRKANVKPEQMTEQIGKKVSVESSDGGYNLTFS